VFAAAYLNEGFHVAFVARVFAYYNASNRPATKAALTFFAGTLFAVLLFPPLNVALAILVLSVGDGVAAIAGLYLGRHKLFNGKTLEGPVAFFISAFVVLVLFIAPTKAGVIALITAPQNSLRPLIWMITSAFLS
jgi:dolichol kinase